MGRSMKKLKHSYSSLPDDIALKIASSLQVADLCALASCSRYWRQICASGHIWEALVKERWPLSGPVVGRSGSAFPSRYPNFQRNSKKWRRFYIKLHSKIAKKTESVVKGLALESTSNSVKAADYYIALNKLLSMGLGFKDAEMFLLKPNMSVLVNLIGLNYCLFIEIPNKDVSDALQRLEVSERQVFVKCSVPERSFNGFRMMGRSFSRLVSLMEFAASGKHGLLKVIFLGAIHQGFCVRIYPGNSIDTPATPS